MSESNQVQFLRAQLNLANSKLEVERGLRISVLQRSARARVLLYDLAVRLVPEDLDRLRQERGEVEDAAVMSDEDFALWLRQRLEGYLFHYRQMVSGRDLEALQRLQKTIQQKDAALQQRDTTIDELTREREAAQQQIVELKDRIGRLNRDVKELIQSRDELAGDLVISRALVEQQKPASTVVIDQPPSVTSIATSRFPAASAQSPAWYAEWLRATPPEIRECQRVALHAIGQGQAFFRTEVIEALNAAHLLTESDPDRPGGTGQRVLRSLLLEGDGFVAEIDVNVGPTVPRPLQLTAKGQEAYRLLYDEELDELPFAQLLKRHKTPEHTLLCLLARRAISRFGHTAIDLALDPIPLPSDRLAHPDLKSVSPDGEVLYWECETGKVQRTLAERDAKWAAHCELNHNHFYVFVPTNEAQKNVVSEINLWLDEHRPLQVWLALCQYAKAMRADKPALWAINSKYMVE
jgi:hypothetical protein